MHFSHRGDAWWWDLIHGPKKRLDMIQYGSLPWMRNMNHCRTTRHGTSREKECQVKMDLQNKTSIWWIYYQVQGSVSCKGIFTCSWVGLQWNICPCFKNGFHKVGFGHCSFKEMGGTSHGCEKYLPPWWLEGRYFYETTWGVYWGSFLSLQIE